MFSRLQTSSPSFPRVSLRAALGLSVLVHVLAFCLSALVYSLLRSPARAAVPPLLEFVFMPNSETAPRSENAAMIATEDLSRAEPPNLQSGFAPSELLSVENHTGPASESDEALTTRVDANAPESFSHLPFSRNLFARESQRTLPRYDGLPLATLVPAKFPLQAKEEQRLNRTVAKLATKPAFFTQRDTSFTFEAGGEHFTAHIRHRPASSATDIDEAEITITTEKNGQQWQTQMRMKRLAFSHFAQFVDDWDPRVAVHDDQLDGRFHTNTAFQISSSNGVKPKFQGKVTTAAYDIRRSNSFLTAREEEIFLAGLETGAREIRMPQRTQNFFSTEGLPDSLCHRFTEETWIQFNADGSYSWRSATRATNARRKLPRTPFVFVGDKKATLHVEGVVRGKVLVQSEKKIIVDDDLTYARAPERYSDSEDYLGLVCRKDIAIAAPHITGPGDLHVYAAILAGGRFVVTNLYHGEKATLHIYGSLSAGSLSATEPRYATHVRFDKRLEQRRPPYFPNTDQYEISDWPREWEMVMPKESGEE